MPSPESLKIRAAFTRPTEINTTPIPRQRQQWNEAALSEPLPENTSIESITVFGIHCERITCGDVTTDKLFIHLHGGGFIVGSCITHRKLAAHLSLTLGMPVLLVDYRLAPEHPFPSGLDDVIAVYRGLLQQGHDASQVFLGGDSAGGGLVVSSMLMLRDATLPLPAAAILISPWLDLALTGDSISSHKDRDPFITDFDLRDTANHYVSNDQLKYPLVSPIYADVSGLSPVLIQVGHDELLLSDATRFADRAQSDGVDVTLEVWDGMWHVWHSHVPDLPEAQQALAKIRSFIQHNG